MALVSTQIAATRAVEHLVNTAADDFVNNAQTPGIIEDEDNVTDSSAHVSIRETFFEMGYKKVIFDRSLFSYDLIVFFFLKKKLLLIPWTMEEKKLLEEIDSSFIDVPEGLCGVVKHIFKKDTLDHLDHLDLSVLK